MATALEYRLSVRPFLSVVLQRNDKQSATIEHEKRNASSSRYCLIDQ